MTMAFAVTALVLGVARLAMFVGLHVVRSDYNPIEHAVSDYAVGRTRTLASVMTWTTAAMWAALVGVVGSGFPPWQQRIGVLATLFGVVLSSVIGALVLRLQGVAVLRQVQATVNRGELPGRQVADAMLVGVGAALMIVPWYLTTLVGLLLVLPPVRGLIYRALARRVRVVAEPPRSADPQLIELDSDDWRER